MSEIEATLKTANDMHTLFKTLQKNPVWAKKPATEKIAHMQGAGYSDFITKHSVPTRYMLVYEEYTARAFRKYLVRLKAVGYNSKSDWVDRQADYVRMLWRSYNPHGTTTDANAQWQYARESIKTEMDDFEKDFESAKTRAEDARKQAVIDNKNTLKQLLSVPSARECLQALYDSKVAR